MKKKVTDQKAHETDFALPGLKGFRIGRYTDNNKTAIRNQRWYDANVYYREGEYKHAIRAFLEYLSDEVEENLCFYMAEDGVFNFQLHQGSRLLHGEGNLQHLKVWTPIAVMSEPAIAAMRRLLELNYKLKYTRCSLTSAYTLCMMFDTDIASASPTKLYKGLRELAVHADHADELMLADFPTLTPADMDHWERLSEADLNTCYNAYQHWIKSALASIAVLNPDQFAGALSYTLLGTLYRIDFLLGPEAKLQNEVENIHNLYWEKKDEKLLIERNEAVRNKLRKLLEWSIGDLGQNLYCARNTFGVAAAAGIDKLKENILSANRDLAFYIENKYPEIALRINEYGLLYPCYYYSLPRVCLNLITVYMAVLHAQFFTKMGMETELYDTGKGTFEKDEIARLSQLAIAAYQSRYPFLHWDDSKVDYTNLLRFCLSFSKQLAGLNLEEKQSL